jgi:glycosylphosphatidylinositol transamidase
VLSVALFVVLTALPALVVSLWTPTEPSTDDGSVRLVLKALNLCFASTVISIITVLNFSLAASLALLLGIPLSISSPSSKPLRTLVYVAYSLLGTAWLLVAQPQVLQSLWYWKILGVWYAPFMCIVYVPLVLQSMVVCLLS